MTGARERTVRVSARMATTCRASWSHDFAPATSFFAMRHGPATTCRIPSAFEGSYRRAGGASDTSLAHRLACGASPSETRVGRLQPATTCRTPGGFERSYEGLTVARRARRSPHRDARAARRRPNSPQRRPSLQCSARGACAPKVMGLTQLLGAPQASHSRSVSQSAGGNGGAGDGGITHRWTSVRAVVRPCRSPSDVVYTYPFPVPAPPLK